MSLIGIWYIGELGLGLGLGLGFVQIFNLIVPQNLEIKAQKSEKFRIGVLGASGYTGSEIIRLIASHPNYQITLMTADRKAGLSIGSVFPHLVRQDLPDMVAVKDADFSPVDAVFCCLPHGTTQEIIKGLPSSLKIVDLSADFRLQDVAEYEEWYGQPHRAQELQKEAVYGLTEICRPEIQNARLVANPGCYPTSIQLPLIPLIKANLIEVKNIIIDSKSGVSGAGRGAKEANLYTEIAEGIHSYGVTRHRHGKSQACFRHHSQTMKRSNLFPIGDFQCQIEQGLSEAAKSKVTVSFTPHLMPMSRGMQSTIYVEMAPGASTEDLYQHLRHFYEKEEFVVLLGKNEVPHTRHVRGSNYCLINVFPDRIPGRAIIISVIDNLVKGASGQALQNLNLMMEKMALNFNASAVYSLQNLPSFRRTQSCILSWKPNQLCQNTPRVFCSMNMAADQSGDSRKLSIGDVVEKARRLWDSSPQPVKSFPWNKTLDNFIQLVVDLVLAVFKYLSIPLFTVTSISEMSYCAHERKLYLIPLPFLVGVAVAGVLKDAALGSSPYLEHAEVPWHLIAVVIFFTLLKFPGPYYPYWGRIFIPHFANGALLRTLWFMFLWSRRPRRTSENNQPALMTDNHKTDEA
ncbi:putative N-acetyl-gamma-glutamyl-phosphate reductase, chloroplastic [Sesamum angolense]|uniref:N-acetyl-gamma-glutamyl-phosphate reductase, chloroplastic n=1 Tax=Sesamum angolense TaxID=2727404 RepID=A0AAE1X4J4_9LAMI|nr:putative N-acetyl-gamma-glutamyl-phosphate reductase, chloroplastic [Sesamum angolense]